MNNPDFSKAVSSIRRIGIHSIQRLNLLRRKTAKGSDWVKKVFAILLLYYLVFMIFIFINCIKRGLPLKDGRRGTGNDQVKTSLE